MRQKISARAGALLCLFLLALCATAHASELVIESHLHYDDVSGDCSFETGACAPLSDCWGFDDEVTSGQFALVGVANGVDLVNVTDMSKPARMNALVRGCVTEWRDIKVYRNVVYIVNDRTSLCTCEEQPCQLQIKSQTSTDTTMMDASEGKVGMPLASFPDGLSGDLVMMDGDGCSAEQYSDAMNGKVVAVPRGECMFGDKVRLAQAVGAIGVVILNHRVDIIYPSMAGNGTGIDIPVVIIGKDSADSLNATLLSGETVTITMDASFKVDSPYYSGPDGLIVATVESVSNFHELFRTRDYFDFAHNLIIDTERGFMYICGFVPGSGGIMAFSLEDPKNPSLIGLFNDTYIHDVEVETRSDGTHVLYGCGIYDKIVYVFDVTDPHGDFAEKIITSFETIEWPHNSAATLDDRFLYVTHEEVEYPITVWNVEDLNNIYYVSNVSFGADHGTIPHNAFIDGTRLWMSYYSEGVLVFDTAADPAHPPIIGHADTSPQYDSGFHGVWGVYVLGYGYNEKESNWAYASDIEEGFFVLQLTEGGDSGGTSWVWWVLGGVAVLMLVLAIGVFVVMRRRRVRYITNESPEMDL
eukprot:TRINITY_DN4664_c1_g1_i2.p1 TRINITY_DN4664_c1_g1~~TRINITY_DN4664_c1_g1_i2.p1  ORF type:complete len:585 (+),score=167.34 TRINITY_DN4664_c1_g1_i2:189-1943(+)